MYGRNRKVGGEMIITETLKNKTSQIKTFSQKEIASKKSETQKKIDESYNNSVLSVRRLVSEVVATSKESKFEISDSIRIQLKDLFSLCMTSVEKEKVEYIDINGISSKEKEVRSSLQYEWHDYYLKETEPVEEVLNVIKGIANVDVNSLLIKMKSAKDWNQDVVAVREMMRAIKEANEQIDKMKLTDTTVEFLRRVIGKTATLNDITDEVMDWLTEEGIKGKVKISF